MTTEELISGIRVIPDFPTKGIMFQDVTTLFKDPDCLSELSDRIYDLYKYNDLVRMFNPAKVYLNCIINLKDCSRRPN